MDDTRPLSGVPGVLAGRYRLLGSIGQGGMADVQRAYDEQLDREVAVKILHARYADDPSFLMRFRREARAAASLNHPNIVSVYDAGDEGGRPFIVMELVRGRSLRDVTRSERTTAGRALEIVGDSALALDYAHEHGLVHRDIKPGNILVSHDGEIKVTDFGIARAVNAETITETAAVFGTAAYVSPEQAQGETVDRRSDVYSLGCVLYELLAGRQPFQADSPVALAYQHVSAMPTPPSHVSDESTPELDAITLKAMAKHPDDRYQSAREFNADLERARAGVPVTAPMGGAYAATQAAGYGNDDATVVSSRAPASYTQTYGQTPDEYDDRYYDDEPPPSRTGWIIFAIVALLALLAGGWFLFTNLAGDTVETAALPDVTGTKFDEAEGVLTGLGFTNISRENIEQSEAEEDEVVEQVPPASEAGEAIPLDTKIVLTVNTGKPLVEIPDVAGETRGDAADMLREAKLRVGETDREESDEIEEGKVIRTDPEAGDEVPEDSEVDLVISAGSSTATVPDVTGLSQSDAEQRLNDACEPQPCFEVSTSREFSEDVDEGDVISQTPQGGRETEKGARVALVISRGPEEKSEPPPDDTTPDTVAVPDVIGLPIDEVLVMLNDANLLVNQVSQPDEEAPADIVIEIEPTAGTEVDELSTVTVVVSTGPETTGDDAGGDGGG